MKKIIYSFIFSIFAAQFSLAQESIGQPCGSDEEAAAMPGRYRTAAQYPWPAARAEYFRDINAADRTSAKIISEQIEKIELNSRNGVAPTGGSLENTFTAYGYRFYNGTKLAAFGTSSGFHKWNCFKNKIDRNGEFSSVLRVYVNNFPLNELEKTSPLERAFSIPDYKYFYKDWKNYKAGVDSEPINLLSFLSYKEIDGQDFLYTINSGNGYWQNVPENKIRQNTYDYIYRYWIVKKSGLPLLVEVSRKEYLESLLEYFEREKLSLAEKTTRLYDSEKKYYENWQSVIENKKQLVNKALKEHNAEWLSKPAFVSRDEDIYLNRKEKLSDYTSEFTFRTFYDGHKTARRLYKINPAYFSGKGQKPTDPAFIVISFRYVSKTAHLKLMNNFTENLDTIAWQKLLK